MAKRKKDAQVSSGELHNCCGKEKESLPAKKETVEIVPPPPAQFEFKTIRESVEELDPKEIRPVPGIPDYREATRSLNPIVVKSPDICYCIDGGEVIQRALVEGRASILCYVSHVSRISELEAAIRKAAIRTFPQGGEACYGEIIRNTGILFDMILASKENPVVFYHGGPRWKGMGASNNGEENVRHVVAARIGKSIVTTDKYLSFREWLNEEAFRVLIEHERDKEFFEKAQKPK
ncbi:MAG TPA: hypothetical protein VEH09_09715, partial [Thermodesulfobacteriota bacterium]|nr:hypothetical protein [Thermodesulfobacteriota bacterium]